ncbi:hypothetical protein [Cloacibacillus sp. An23]|uniref:hypothetical protein n=1 Tax=Cloacibacillus sp. An23 TaxID=1965591 RepID=UPI001177E731|nr:hypothetical protein [Cloacibacillus sp. An23]
MSEALRMIIFPQNAMKSGMDVSRFLERKWPKEDVEKADSLCFKMTAVLALVLCAMIAAA